MNVLILKNHFSVNVEKNRWLNYGQVPDSGTFNLTKINALVFAETWYHYTVYATYTGNLYCLGCKTCIEGGEDAEIPAQPYIHTKLCLSGLFLVLTKITRAWNVNKISIRKLFQ